MMVVELIRLLRALPAEYGGCPVYLATGEHYQPARVMVVVPADGESEAGEGMLTSKAWVVIESYPARVQPRGDGYPPESVGGVKGGGS